MGPSDRRGKKTETLKQYYFADDIQDPQQIARERSDLKSGDARKMQ